MTLSTVRRARLHGSCLALALFNVCPVALPQTTAKNPIQKIGKYAVELRIPAAGLAASEETDVEFRVTDTSQPNPIQGAALVMNARVTAEIAMPTMPGMSLGTPKTHVQPAPGDYGVILKFPHGGDYRLTLTITPPGDKQFTVSFKIAVGESAKSGQPMSQHGMHGMEPFAGIPMMREASGTSWQPDSSPMHGEHKLIGLWKVMQHYNAFLNYDLQGGPRGNDQANSINWYMLMGSRPLGRGELLLRTMLSLEPLTVGKHGYPLLFQSGESLHGKPLVDIQHPHDFFMELAGRYRQSLNANTSAYLYFAPSGEPALGPSAFMHRSSAQNNPIAPITHHWQDSTHITFGVVTAGISHDNWQLEGSYFNGREPDERRWDIDPIRFNSYSGRLTYNPGPNWSLQGSYGYVKSPEALRPGEDVHRTTFSASYNRPLSDGGNWASTLVWGRNNIGGWNSDSILLESDYNIANRNTLFGRLEHVEKLGEDLAMLPSDRKFPITELTIGGVHELTPGRLYQSGVGAAVTFNWKPKDLDAVYGSNPMGFWLFLRIRPAAMQHGSGHGEGMSHAGR